MGYSTTRFQKPVDPNLICAICSGVLESPVLTPCGHSFCELCVRTWLGVSGANTCPQCRAWVEGDAVKSILSLKNLIEAMEVTCIHCPRGCNAVTNIDKHDLHLQSCKFVPVICAGCQIEVNTSELAEHQMECAAIQKELEADDDITHITDSNNKHSSLDNDGKFSSRTFCTLRQPRNLPVSTSVSRGNSAATSHFQITRLQSRISSLEKQVGRLLEDLQESHNKNSFLYLRYRKVKDELEDQRRVGLEDIRARTMAHSWYNFDFIPFEMNTPDQQDIARLSLLIARSLLRKPNYMDGERVFQAIRSCYEAHFPGVGIESERKDHDVHMLLATAYASNWFSPAQRIILSCWLQCVLRCQGCRRLVEG